MAESAEGSGRRSTETVKHPKIPLFYGYGKGKDEVGAKDLVNRIEAHCTNTGKETQCSELYLVLRGKAIEWYDSLPTIGVDQKNWENVKTKFLTDYDYKMPGSMAYQLNTLNQKKDESVVDFFSRVDKVISEFNMDAPVRTNALCVNTRLYYQKGIFISGLKEEIKAKVLEQQFSTLLEAKEYSQMLEFIAANKEKGAGVSAVTDLETELDAIMGEDNPDNEMQEDEIALLNKFRMRQGRRPFRGGYRGRGGASNGPRFNGSCYNCGMNGHKSAQCRQPRKNDVKSVEEDGQTEQYETASIKNW